MSKSVEDVFIGKRLREARVGKGYSQAKLANEFGITSQQIQKLEAGLNRISAKMLYKLSNLCEQPMEWFVQDLGDMQRKTPDKFSNSSFPLRMMRYLSQIQDRQKQLKALKVVKMFLEE